MLIKIALSHQLNHFITPIGFHSDREGTEWRMDLANYLETNAKESRRGNTYDYGLGGIQHIPDFDTEYISSKRYAFRKGDFIHSINVVEVDTDVPWLIHNYHGHESIDFVPIYKPIDNYGQHILKP